MSLNKSLMILKDDCLRRKNMVKEMFELSFKDFMKHVDQCNIWALGVAIESKSITKMVFYVVPSSVNNFLWRLKAEIEFQKINLVDDVVLKTRVLKLHQFLLIHREISNLTYMDQLDTSRLQYSMMIQRIESRNSENLSVCSDSESVTGTSECSICCCAKADVILPCSHSYCEACTMNWSNAEADILRQPTWQVLQSSTHIDWSPETLIAQDTGSLESLVMDTCHVGHFTCPVCRVKCSSQSDLWHVLDKPQDFECHSEMSKNLQSLLDKVGRDKK